MSTESVLRVDVADHVATLTLNRPKSLNALNLELLETLGKEFAALHNSKDVRAIVLTGEGRGFCAGGDLKSFGGGAGGVGAGFRFGASIFHVVTHAIHTSPKPVIAAMNGLAVGGGFSLALACDFRVMAEDAYVQGGYLGRGLSTDGGLSFFLPRLVGPTKAMEIAAFDERIPAERCLELGIVSRVSNDPITEATKMAATLARGAAPALAKAKELMRSSLSSSLGEQLERERLGIAACSETAEGQEGLMAFLLKRDPDFIGAGTKK